MKERGTFAFAEAAIPYAEVSELMAGAPEPRP
jgi:hypothetical protein